MELRCRLLFHRDHASDSKGAYQDTGFAQNPFWYGRLFQFFVRVCKSALITAHANNSR